MEVYENEIFIVCKYFKNVNKGKKDLFYVLKRFL